MSETIFSEKATKYSEGRLGYAPEAIEKIFSCFIKPGESVADIGSGTGILSCEFLKRGIDVFCVEPDDNMRHKAEEAFSTEKHFHSVAASAERTGLSYGSISLITAASSFHWFNHMAFRSECLRLLKPGGIVCIMINARQYDNDLTLRQHELCLDYCPTYRSLHHGFDETIKRIPNFFGYEPEHIEYSFPLCYTAEGFLARCLSSSYSPASDDENYLLYTEKLRALIAEYSVDGKIYLANKTHMFSGRMLI